MSTQKFLHLKLTDKKSATSQRLYMQFSISARISNKSCLTRTLKLVCLKMILLELAGETIFKIQDLSAEILPKKRLSSCKLMKKRVKLARLWLSASNLLLNVIWPFSNFSSFQTFLVQFNNWISINFYFLVNSGSWSSVFKASTGT